MIVLLLCALDWIDIRLHHVSDACTSINDHFDNFQRHSGKRLACTGGLQYKSHESFMVERQAVVSRADCTCC